jgi:cobalamin transport system substrate-binding protein
MLRQHVSRIVTILAALSLLIGACSSKASPTATFEPTATAKPAATLAPTNTAAPAATQAPINTQEPTATTTTSASFTFTDDFSRTVTLAGPAERVVSLAPSNTEMLFYVGAGSQTVGRDEFSDYPAEVKDLPSVGGSYGGYDLESIVKLKPDLVLAAEINTREQIQAISDLGLNIYYLANPVSLDTMYKNLETVARLTGHEVETVALIESLKARVAAVVENVKRTAADDRPLVYYELDASDANAPFTPGAGTFVDTLITLAGGRNMGSALTTPWAQISAEKVIEMNPLIILLGDAAYGVTPELVAKRPGWNAIEAVKNSNIYPFDDNLASRPGPRLVDGLEALVKIIHPELYR